MKRFISSLALATTLIAAPATASPNIVTCTRDYGSSVNLRSGPSRQHGIIASLPAGMYIEPLSWVWGGDGMRWVRVQAGGLIGWARGDFLCTQ